LPGFPVKLYPHVLLPQKQGTKLHPLLDCQPRLKLLALKHSKPDPSLSISSELGTLAKVESRSLLGFSRPTAQGDFGLRRYWLVPSEASLVACFLATELAIFGHKNSKFTGFLVLSI
jgi:hypothetical protein